MDNQITKNFITAMNIIELILAKQLFIKEAFEQKTKNKTEQEKKLLFAIVSGTMRKFIFYNHYINNTCKLKPKDNNIRILLITALYQCHDMEHKNTSQIIYYAVETCRKIKRNWACNIVNAVLNKSLIGGCLEKNQTVSSQNSLPLWLFKEITKHYKEKEYRQIIKGWEKEPTIVNVRVNLGETNINKYTNILKEEKIQHSMSKVSPLGIIIPKEKLKQIPGLKENIVYIQDPIHQIIPSFFKKLSTHARVLDACGAPGGKTGALLNHFPKHDLNVLVIDKSSKKIPITSDNLKKFKNNITIQEADILKNQSWWDKKDFDAILLDAPCSGTGVISKHPEIKVLRQKKDILSLQKKQIELLKNVWVTLKKGGQLIYSTCSILPAENEEVIKEHCRNHPDCKIEKLQNPITKVFSSEGITILPSDDNTGSFFCLLKKE